MVEAYWTVGRKIVEEEQFGKKRAVYGEFLIEGLAARLKDELGSGFDVTNLKRMRQFYVLFPKGATAWHFLSWSHFKAVLRVEKEDARAWYLQEASEQNWSVRALERQIGALVFASQYRLVLPTEEELRREIERERDLVIREHMENYGTGLIKKMQGLEFCGSPGRFAQPPSDALCEAGRANRPGEPPDPVSSFQFQVSNLNFLKRAVDEFA